jgi:hypothetical protein
VGSRNLGLFLQFASVKLLEGNRAMWETAGEQLADLAERTHDANVQLSSTGHKIQELLMDGRIEEAMRFAESAMLVSLERGIAFAPASSPLGQASAYLGLHPTIHIGDVAHAGPMMLLMSLAVPPHVGEFPENAVRDALQDFEDVAGLSNPSGSAVDMNLQPTGALLLGALRFKDKPRLQTLLDLAGLGDGTAFTLPAVIMSVARLCGAAAIVLENVPRARQLTEKAVTDCEQIRHRPELALSHLQLAELLLDHYPDERDAAIEHLDFAIAELQDMKMQPALERALRHRGLLKA